MNEHAMQEIRAAIQDVIDLIASKNSIESSKKLIEVNEKLDNLIDNSTDENLMELSQIQVLLNHLQQKIVDLKVQMN